MNTDAASYIESGCKLRSQIAQLIKESCILKDKSDIFKGERDSAHEYLRRSFLLMTQGDTSGLEAQLTAAIKEVRNIEQRECGTGNRWGMDDG